MVRVVLSCLACLFVSTVLPTFMAGQTYTSAESYDRTPFERPKPVCSAITKNPEALIEKLSRIAKADGFQVDVLGFDQMEASRKLTNKEVIGY